MSVRYILFAHTLFDIKNGAGGYYYMIICFFFSCYIISFFQSHMMNPTKFVTKAVEIAHTNYEMCITMVIILEAMTMLNILYPSH